MCPSKLASALGLHYLCRWKKKIGYTFPQIQIDLAFMSGYAIFAYKLSNHKI